MTATLTVEQLRKHVETALDDDALQQVLDAQDAILTRWAGAADGVVETVYARDLTLLPLQAEPATITTVTDWRGTTSTILTPGDFRIRGRYLERAQGGGPAFPPVEDLGIGWPVWPQAWTARDPLWSGNTWGDRTEVEYVPVDGNAERIQTLILLVKLALNFEPGMSGQTAGPWGETYSDFLRQQQEILRAFREPELFG